MVRPVPRRTTSRSMPRTVSRSACGAVDLVIPMPSHSAVAGVPMDIVIESLLEGAKRATGNVAIIDVFRAFTTAAVALANGASHIIMVGSVDEALALRGQGFGEICMGEVGGRAP